MPSDLESAIFRTVAFFSLFDFPVTAFEIWKWLAKPATSYRLEEVMTALAASPWLASRLQTRDGFFVLQGKRETIALRHTRFLDATRKFKRLRRACYYLGFLPMVKSLNVCNTLAWMNTKPESDIDLFIITKPRRVWTTRLLAVFPFALLGMRPKGGAVDPICFSFFTSEDNLSLRDLRLNKHDLYLAQWVRSLVPVVDRDRHADFIEANRWVDGIFPNSFAVRPVRRRRSTIWKRHADLCKLIEPFSRSLQRSRLPSEIKQLANRDSRVIVSDTMLKFHPNDRRAEFIAKLESLCTQS